MKQYVGKRFFQGTGLHPDRAWENVKVEVQMLRPVFKDGQLASYQVERAYPLVHRVYHSPTGFEWGYAGSGPADLARSILADCLGDKIGLNGACYQLFKFAFIAAAPRAGFTLTEFEIRAWYVLYLINQAKDAGRWA